MEYHIFAFGFGFLLDLLLGDPYWLPHPIRLIGTLIGALEKRWNREENKKAFRNGVFLVLTVTVLTTVITAFILGVVYFWHPLPGMILETIMTYQILAAKCLKTESMKVYYKLTDGDLEGAREAVSMIVGRDTKELDETGITKAAIETVAENTSDGVIAPMIYTAIGGPVLGFLYKSINTIDSMVGYQNDRYMYFGRVAAKLDDFVNYLPSRISAYLMMVSCLFLGKEYHGKQAFQIHKRDSRKHTSPNSAQTESACAGALGIQLAGDASYFGVIHKKPYIGEPIRPVEYEDIKRANRLLYGTAFICEAVCLLILMVLYYIC